MTSPTPPRSVRILFWIQLGLLSTYFAESVGGSTLFPFTTLSGWVFVIPVYFLHIVVLAAIVIRSGRPTFSTLYAGGMLFGMYEAYMTKVLWISNSPQGPPMTIGGVSALDFALLVLFWHPLMGFIVPVAIASRLSGCDLSHFGAAPPAPRFGEPRHWLVFAAICGANQALHSPSPLHSLAAGAAALVVLAGTNALLIGHHVGRYELRDLVPGGRELAVLGGMLGIAYAVISSTYRVERLPPMGPQLTVWTIYTVLIGFFLFHLKKSRAAGQQSSIPAGISPRLWLRMLILTTVTSAALSLILGMFGLQSPIFLASLVISAMAGVFLFFRAAADLLRDRRTGSAEFS